MKNRLRNTGYFFREAGRIIGMNRLSNIFSLLGTVLILFVFGLVLTGWRTSSQWVDMLQKEAEISAYFDEGTDSRKASELVNIVKELDGVWDARWIGAEEAHIRMEEILGEEARILALFEGNPFEAFLEVRIHLDKMDSVMEKITSLEGIDYVRDNREVLEQIQGIANVLEVLGYIVIAAVSITTLVILSHMIRQGIYQNKEHIYTLRLLGAPDGFIGFPYVLVGLLLTLLGGGMASLLLALLLNQGYGKMEGILPFIPLPSMGELVSWPVLMVMGMSIVLGILGSLFGLTSTNKENNR